MDKSEKEELLKLKPPIQKCSSCKEFWHNFRECERDPNLKIEKEVEGEIERAETISKKINKNE